ncbi:MAG: SxtJ family membrane protein [Rhodothermales bacterium]
MNSLRILWQEIQNVDTSKKALRSFGWVVGIVLVGIGAIVWWRLDWTATRAVYWLGGIGGTLIVLGLAAPWLLKPIYRVWMALAVVLGFVMTRVILTLVYCLIITPIGLVFRLIGKDPMQRTIDRNASSYWIEKKYIDESPKRLEKYY